MRSLVLAADEPSHRQRAALGVEGLRSGAARSPEQTEDEIERYGDRLCVIFRHSADVPLFTLAIDEEHHSTGPAAVSRLKSATAVAHESSSEPYFQFAYILHRTEA